MILQQLVNGLTIGGIYALVALGYSMVYGVLRIVNFAHGDILMLGTFIGLTICEAINIPVYIAVFIGALITAFIGILVERFAYRPIHSKDGLAVLISALGVSIFIQNLARLIWGSETHSYPANIEKVTYDFGSFCISNIQIMIIGLTILLLIALYFMIYHTKMGVAMRASSFSMTNARLMGINTNKIIAFTFGIGSLMAGIAGNLIGIYYDAVYPTMGFSMGMKAFSAAILGGIGSIQGAVCGGFLIGIVEIFGTVFLSSSYRDAYAYIVLIIILILKPSGILGKKVQEKV